MGLLSLREEAEAVSAEVSASTVGLGCGPGRGYPARTGSLCPQDGRGHVAALGEDLMV